MKLKDTCSLEEKLCKSRQHIKNQRHYFANKGLSSQSYGFSSSHVWMWELDYKESWVPKNRCFWTVVLEMTLESPLDSKEIKPINPKGNQPWIFTGRTDAKVDAPILWLPDANSRLIERQLRMGKIEGRRGVGDTGLDGWMGPLEHTLVDSEGQGSLVCCSSWGCRVGHNSATKQQYQSIECINPLKCFLKAQPPYN